MVDDVGMAPFWFSAIFLSIAGLTCCSMMMNSLAIFLGNGTKMFINMFFLGDINNIGRLPGWQETRLSVHVQAVKDVFDSFS